MAALHIRLLGGFEARLATGEALPLKGRKTQALLAYLAFSPGQTHSREELVGLLWGDRGEQQARSSLRQSLSELRRALGDGEASPLVTDRDSVSLDAAAVEVDVAAFERSADEGTPASLSRAASLYRGDLLDGLGVSDPAFEDWLSGERRRLNERAAEALTALIAHQETSDADGAIATARRLLALDPLREAAHRALMRLYGAKGERTLALKQYQACRDLLAAELGIPPEAETEALADEIRGGAGPAGGDGTPAPEPPPLEAESLKLPEQPSIAVLPFANMSGDPEQAYFCDGIVEDIITALSRISGLLVVARNSTLVYKDRAVDIKQVGREQGVHYVLEGSVRKGGHRVRVSAQLIDATTGHHRWAEHYDRQLDDIFAVQDEITESVAVEMQVQLMAGEQARLRAGGTQSVKARELALRSDELLDRHVREDRLEARRLAEEALGIDPNYAHAWASLGWTYWEDAYWGWGRSSEEDLQSALDAAQKALANDATHPDAHALLGTVYLLKGEHAKAVEAGRKAAALAPSHAEVHALWAYALNAMNKPKEAMQAIRRALRLCPIYPAWYLVVLSDCYRLTGEQDLAVDTLRKAVAREPDSALAIVWLANILVEAGLVAEAKAAAEKVLAIDPTFTLSRGAPGINVFQDPALNQLTLENLRKAGLPG